MADRNIQELNQVVRMMMRFIADLSLSVETCHQLLIAHGVTPEEYSATHERLRREFEASGKDMVARLRQGPLDDLPEDS